MVWMIDKDGLKCQKFRSNVSKIVNLKRLKTSKILLKLLENWLKYRKNR